MVETELVHFLHWTDRQTKTAQPNVKVWNMS